MKIQTKISLLISTIALIFIIGITFFKISEDAKIETLYKEREEETRTSFQKNIESTGKSLEVYAYDYSYWDELIEFINKEDSAWAYINIHSTIPSFNVQYAWVYDKDLNLVYSTNTIEQSQQQDLFLTKETLQKVLKNGYFSHFYLIVSEGLLEIRGAPVQPSNDLTREAIPYGYLFVGRLWTENLLSDISLQTSSKISLENSKEKLVKNTNWNKDFKVTVSTKLPGWDGEPVMWLNSTRDLPMIKDLSEFVNNQVLYSLAFSILVLVIVSISLFKVVNQPLKIISQSIKEKNPALLNSLVKSKAEFGKLSSLLVQFFKISESSLQKLSSAIEQSSISVMITNVSGEVEYVNTKFIKMNGYTIDEVKGQNLRDLKFGSDFEKTNKVLFETMHSGMEWKGELLNEMKNGELYWEYVLVS
ncbi:MAG TPA: CHASE4 domain-containing protein, partial [Ignavibacteriaceae bacterium]|nr:CHASE4 domain-containing protein [Ignavibacteriaceae bacterium]